MTIPWAQNDALFKKLVSDGHAWQALPFIFLKLSGFDVEMPNLTIRPHISEAKRWLHTYDLKIGEHLIEVKSRPFRFTGPQDWPSPRLPAFLDTTKKWEAKPAKPFAYIFVSKPTGGMVSTCSVAGASGRWERLWRFDHVRKINEEFYAVGRQHLVTMDVLVDALRKDATNGL